jgi:hypothetical protein
VQAFSAACDQYVTTPRPVRAHQCRFDREARPRACRLLSGSNRCRGRRLCGLGVSGSRIRAQSTSRSGSRRDDEAAGRGAPVAQEIVRPRSAPADLAHYRPRRDDVRNPVADLRARPAPRCRLTTGRRAVARSAAVTIGPPRPVLCSGAAPCVDVTGDLAAGEVPATGGVGADGRKCDERARPVAAIDVRIRERLLTVRWVVAHEPSRVQPLPDCLPRSIGDREAESPDPKTAPGADVSHDDGGNGESPGRLRGARVLLQTRRAANFDPDRDVAPGAATVARALRRCRRLGRR